MAAKTVLKKKRPAAYPVSGFVSFNWRNSSLGSVVANFKENLIYLDENDLDKLNLAMRIANRRGFMVAMVCPKDGAVVHTWRSHDLEDGVYAKCPDCDKVWLNNAD